MSDLELSMEAIGLINEAEKRLRARIRDAVDEGDRIVFITEKGHLGQALGKEAKNLQMMRELLKKDVKFVEWDEDKQVFVRNLFKPFDVASIRLETLGVTPRREDGAVAGEGQPQEGDDAATAPAPAAPTTSAAPAPARQEAAAEQRIRAIVEVEAKDKGKAIGKQGRNISSIRHIAKRHQGIDEVQVI